MADAFDPMQVDAARPDYRGNDRRSTTDLRGSYYGGPDRRVVSAARTRSLTTEVMLWLVAGIALAVVVARAIHGSSSPVTAYADLRNIAAAVLALTGALLLVTWAMTGGARHALDGVAMLQLGGGTLVLAGPLGGWLHPAGPMATLSPGVCVALTFPAVVLLIRSTVIRQVESTIRPLAVALQAAFGAAFLLALEAMARTSGPAREARVWQALLIAAAVGWVVGGARRLVPAPGEDPVAGTAVMAWALLGLGASDVLLAVALDHSPSWGLAAVALMLVCVAVAARVALVWLVSAIADDSERRLRLAGEVADLSIVLADETRVRQRMVRDAQTLLRVVRRGGDGAEQPTEIRLDDHVVVLPPDSPVATPKPTPAYIATAYADPPVTTTQSWKL